MMTRILPRDEWPRLAGTEAEVFVSHLSDAARVVVVDNGVQILGCHVLQPVLHAEGLWIHPEHRGHASVARRLWAGVRMSVSREFRVGSFVTGCDSDDVRGLLEHIGAVKLPDHYVVQVGG